MKVTKECVISGPGVGSMSLTNNYQAIPRSKSPAAAMYHCVECGEHMWWIFHILNHCRCKAPALSAFVSVAQI